MIPVRSAVALLLPAAAIDWPALRQTATAYDGIPTRIGSGAAGPLAQK